MDISDEGWCFLRTSLRRELEVNDMVGGKDVEDVDNDCFEEREGERESDSVGRQSEHDWAKKRDVLTHRSWGDRLRGDGEWDVGCWGKEEESEEEEFSFSVDARCRDSSTSSKHRRYGWVAPSHHPTDDVKLYQRGLGSRPRSYGALGESRNRHGPMKS